MDHSIREAVILAGGLGTRLKSVVSNLPKPMADVAGKPFLQYLLDYCHVQGLQKIILCVGYKYEVIESYFGKSYKGMALMYSIENEALGTGGALRQALSFVNSEVFLFLNGDSICEVNLSAMMDFIYVQNADIVLSIKEMKNFDRYGTVVREGDRIVKFEEKKSLQEGWINVGVALLRKEAIIAQCKDVKFSFEKEILEGHTQDLKIFAYPTDAYFIDIGVPEDYERANQKFGSVL